MTTESYGNTKFTEELNTDSDYQPTTTESEQGTSDTPHRHNTLKKKNSVKRRVSVRKSRANSMVGQEENPRSILAVPIPTHNSPTEILASRFQAWRRLLKDYITYFREVQATNEAQAKSLLKLSQTINNQTQIDEAFVRNGGILELNGLLRDFHKEAYLTAENAKSIETEIINHLVGLRGDLNLKIKEIRALSGDFKNNIDKEKEGTKKALLLLTESINNVDTSSGGKNEPYIAKLQAESQIRRQLNEENYLHRAYLNLENSGLELEKIIVREIQKAFETYTQIMRRDGQQMLNAVNRIDQQILQLPPDKEWNEFVRRDPSMVDPNLPVRTFESVEYPGIQHPSTIEVRSGQLERRSKYLKSYTAGWYVLSPTHLHEFKTPDRHHDLTPVMSLYLPDCTLAGHSEETALSHKFVLKGRQTGGMHTRHSWTFRAESHAAMLEWYAAIKKLTEVRGAERDAFVTEHTRTSSEAATLVDLDPQIQEPEDAALLRDDEADEIPYSANGYPSSIQQPEAVSHRRPEVGRFPSDIQVERGRAEAARPASSASSRSFSAVSGHNHGSDYVMISSDPTDPSQPRHHSRSSSAFSYDETHPYTQGLENKHEEVVPVMADVPPEIERRMSVRHEYDYNHEAINARRNSVHRGPPSRKPTASYGVDPVTGLIDPAAFPDASGPPTIDWSQVIHDNGALRRGSIASRGPPSRKPTASYGYDPITGAPDSGMSTSLGESDPVRPSNASILTRDIRVPGDYPRDSPQMQE